MCKIFCWAHLLLLISSWNVSAQSNRPQPNAGGKPQPVVGGYIINGQYHYPNCACAICKQLKVDKDVPPATPPAAPKEDAPPPAPKDPEERVIPSRAPVTPIVKSEGAKVTDKVPSREEIIKTIQNNPQLSEQVKKEILDGLKAEPPKEGPTQTKQLQEAVKEAKIDSPKMDVVPKKFDLLEALKNSTTKPGVKAYSEETPPPFKPADPPKASVPLAKAPLPREIAKSSVAPPKDQKDFLLMPMGVATVEPIGATYEVPPTDIGMSVGSKIDYSTPWDPTKPIPLGKIVQFWVKPVAKRPDKLKNVAYTWTVLPKEDVLVWPDTTRILFSSGTKAQTYVVMLTASYAFLDGEKVVLKTSQVVTMAQVGDSTAPAGGTASAPAPIPPPGLSPIAKLAFDWVNAIRGGGYSDEVIKADAKKVAEVFEKVAAKIDGAQLVDINDIIQVTKSENGKLNCAGEWTPWFIKMSDLLKNGYRDNTIRTPQQYKVVWEEIAKGLNAVAK